MATCPCDDRPFPPIQEIAAGLDRLPRQLATFGEFRRALLDGIDEKPALDLWRAREGDDFGVMTLEWWAYLLDVLAFYSGEIATESYLRTARRDASLRRLVALIGYTPKPPLAASATLALFAEPGQPVRVPAGTAFRSDAFGDEAPQIFETGADVTIDAGLNSWTIAPIREPTFGPGPLLLATGGAAPRAGQVALVTWATTAHAARVASAETVSLLDGADYIQPSLDPAPAIAPGQSVDGIGIFVLPLRAATNPFAGSGAVSRTSSQVTIVLDALYPQIRVGGRVVVEGPESGQLHATSVTATTLSYQRIDGGTSSGGLAASRERFAFDGGGVPMESIELAEASLVADDSGDAPRAPFTKLTLSGAGPAWIGTAAAGSLTLHFAPVPAGRVVRSARTEIEFGDLGGGAALVSPTPPLRQPTTGTVLLRDALKAGASLSGNVTDDGAGQATLTPLSNAVPFAGPLRTPVEAYGNLVTATRGESAEEELGRGDATQTFQRFRLTKTPLTYVSAPGAPAGRASTLEVWVDGTRWGETASFFTAGPSDRVYTLRQTVDGESEITFGDGTTGQRLPTGSTVTARYRFGAGAASPPAGALRQLARPVQGLRRVVNPLAAFGGDDGDDPLAIRTAAPASALSLGRAISLLDFEAIARGYRGILNAAALTAWDESEQRAAVKVWFMPPGPDEADQLRADLETHLRTVSAAGTPVTVAVAVAVPVALSVDFAVAADREPETVTAAVVAALTDPETGLLSAKTVPIGAPVFRADILAAVRATDGVETVRGLSAGGAPAPFAFEVAEGEYLSATVVQEA